MDCLLTLDFRQSVGCFQGVHSQLSSYYEIASELNEFDRVTATTKLGQLFQDYD